MINLRIEMGADDAARANEIAADMRWLLWDHPRAGYTIKPRNALGQMFVLYRAAHRIGVRDLAKDIGLSAATLSRIERGYEPDWTTALKIMQFLLGEVR